jgi:hypothetical protein
MPKEFLHCAQIGTTVEQMGGECVSEGVGMGWRGRASIKKASHVAGTHASALPIQKNGIGRRVCRCQHPSTMTQPLLKRIAGRRT